MRICIIGAGTYGSYLARLISDEAPSADITLFEVGSRTTRSESEMGFVSRSHGARYAALTDGRFFGLGGTSARWGGQILTFGRRDFESPSPFLEGIVDLNVRHRHKVLSRLGISHVAEDTPVDEHLTIKTGAWLSYGKRNLYDSLCVDSLPNVEVRTNCRAIKLLHRDSTIRGVVLLSGANEYTEEFDHYFLTTGAFESNRLLATSGLTHQRFSFSDHLSQRAFSIRHGTKIGENDFRFRFRGTSLITRRLIGEINGVSFFAHPIFNSEFSFFQNLKELLYERRLSLSLIGKLIFSLPQAAIFLFSMFFLRRLYVHKGQWYLQLDLENFHTSGVAHISEELDEQGQPGVEVALTVDEQTDELFASAREIVRKYLEKHGADFQELTSSTDSAKYEDTYHPYGMFGADSASVDDYFDRFSNMLVANTGILPRAGSINCTGAVFPLLEEYVDRHLAALSGGRIVRNSR